jgi:hypothetical protein
VVARNRVHVKKSMRCCGRRRIVRDRDKMNSRRQPRRSGPRGPNHGTSFGQASSIVRLGPGAPKIRTAHYRRVPQLDIVVATDRWLVCADFSKTWRSLGPACRVSTESRRVLDMARARLRTDEIRAPHQLTALLVASGVQFGPNFGTGKRKAQESQRSCYLSREEMYL